MERNIAGNLGIPKLTIIFPPGDQLTSVLLEKEKDNKIEDLINRLCALRGIDLSKLKKSQNPGRRRQQGGHQQNRRRKRVTFHRNYRQEHKERTEKK